MKLRAIKKKAKKEGREIKIKILDEFIISSDNPDLDGVVLEGYYIGRIFPDGDAVIDFFVPDDGEPFEVVNLRPRDDEDVEVIDG